MEIFELREFLFPHRPFILSLRSRDTKSIVQNARKKVEQNQQTFDKGLTIFFFKEVSLQSGWSRAKMLVGPIKTSFQSNVLGQ